MLGQWVEIEFDCLPLRSISRLDVPVDASPKYEQFLLRIKAAMEKHGSYNSYYLHKGRCSFHLTNDSDRGTVSFSFEGVALTDSEDLKTRSLDVNVQLESETCSWLTETFVRLLSESVQHAIMVEFDRYIGAGDLEKARERIEKINQQSDSADGFVGMYL